MSRIGALGVGRRWTQALGPAPRATVTARASRSARLPRGRAPPARARWRARARGSSRVAPTRARCRGPPPASPHDRSARWRVWSAGRAAAGRGLAGRARARRSRGFRCAAHHRRHRVLHSYLSCTCRGSSCHTAHCCSCACVTSHPSHLCDAPLTCATLSSSSRRTSCITALCSTLRSPSTPP